MNRSGLIMLLIIGSIFGQNVTSFLKDESNSDGKANLNITDVTEDGNTTDGPAKLNVTDVIDDELRTDGTAKLNVTDVIDDELRTDGTAKLNVTDVIDDELRTDGTSKLNVTDVIDDELRTDGTSKLNVTDVIDDGSRTDGTAKLNVKEVIDNGSRTDGKDKLNVTDVIDDGSRTDGKVKLKRDESRDDGKAKPNVTDVEKDESRTGRKSNIYEKNAGTCSTVFSCLDCNTARLCRPDGKGGFTQFQKIHCSPNAPYCDLKTGSCSKEPDPTCGAKDESFVCLADGHYPDANCNAYHVCKGLVPTKFTCLTKGENFNANSGKCEPSIECGTFQCKSTGEKVPHTLYKSFYAYCKLANDIALVARCPRHYEMNETSQTCEPICYNEGVLQDLSDCTKYYKCHSLWVSDSKPPYMVRDHHDCPKGTGFDPSNFICVTVPSPELPNCKPK